MNGWKALQTLWTAHSSKLLMCILDFWAVQVPCDVQLCIWALQLKERHLLWSSYLVRGKGREHSHVPGGDSSTIAKMTLLWWEQLLWHSWTAGLVRTWFEATLADSEDGIWQCMKPCDPEEKEKLWLVLEDCLWSDLWCCLLPGTCLKWSLPLRSRGKPLCLVWGMAGTSSLGLSHSGWGWATSSL